jgi:hypothetical protein
MGAAAISLPIQYKGKTASRTDPRDAFVSVIANGLRAASYQRCDRYTCAYRVMGNPYPGLWTFKYHPWTREMHNQDAQECVGQKAAQMGFTETLLNRTFYTIERLRGDVLYILPAKTPDATDFSAARFGPALRLSDHLRMLFTSTDNMGLKSTGISNLYIRGSRSTSGLKSVPVRFIACDEVEEFSEEALVLVKERMSGQTSKQAWYISTPCVPNSGINALFNLSDQREFFFPCPHCSTIAPASAGASAYSGPKLIRLSFPESIVICGESEYDPAVSESHLICPECKHPLSHEDKPNLLAEGQWIPAKPGRSIVGYHINQLYSSTISPGEFAKAAIGAQTNIVKEQEFHNSKCGEPHVVASAAITDAVLQDCTSAFRMRDPKLTQMLTAGKAFTTMGIDVGNDLYVEVILWTLRNVDSTGAATIDFNDKAFGRLLLATSCKNFTDLDTLMYTFKPMMAVIDQLPEKRSAVAFAHRFPGHVHLCHYGNNSVSREISKYNELITVDRTCWLDLALSRFFNKTILLPVDTPIDYKNHVKNTVRVPGKNADGETVFRYAKAGDDHYAHCRNYSEIALALCAELAGGNQSMTEII